MPDFSVTPRRRARFAVAGLSGLIATTGAITVGFVAAPMAASATSSCAAGTPVTSTYASNQLRTFIVPAGVTRVVATAAGGAGSYAPRSSEFTVPGDGAVVTSTLAVTAGDSLTVAVGQVGSGGVGGLSGGNPSGGDTGTNTNVGPGGGGGGASFVTDGATLLIAAGGGGGAGYGGFNASHGGDASANSGQQSAGTIANGGDGQAGQSGALPGLGGGGGTSTPGAAGGTNPNYTGPNATPGSGQQGGEGATPGGDGGGGGGGYAGGGGGGMGGYAGGGGAGSSYGADPYSLSANDGDGSVTLSYELPSVTSANAVSFPTQQVGSFTVCATALPTATITEAGTLPSGVSFVDNGDGTGTLSGTPAAGTEGAYPVTFTAANGDGSNAVQSFTLTVSLDTPAVSLSASPTSSTFGDSVTFTAEVDGASGALAPTGAVEFEDNGGSISPACNVAMVSTTAGISTATCTTTALVGGSHAITATYGGDTDNATGGDTLTDYVVAPATPVVGLQTSGSPSVFGESPSATATVTPSGVAGTVQFSVNGHDLGSPTAVGSLPVPSLPLTDSGDPLAIGDNTVAATFTPTDTTDYTTAGNTVDQVVDQAATTTAVGVAPTALSAAVAVVEPGAGSPTGTVTFSVDGTSVGTATVSGGVATLNDTVPLGQTHDVSALYSGDADFTGSSGSTSRLDPTITAAVTSAHPKTSSGWYRAPVTVTFTCTTNGAPLTSACPAAVTMRSSKGGQSVTRTITASDGGAATVVVDSISIDRVKPHVAIRRVRNHGTYDGTAPTAGCFGTDSLSGIHTCRLATVRSSVSAKDIRTVHYTATATDEAGNTATTHATIRVLGFFVRSAPLAHGAFTVKIGHHYTVGVVSASRPRYIDATPAHGVRTTPFKVGPHMTNAGQGLWTIRISVHAQMRHHALWNLGVKINGKLHVLTIRVTT
jgi:hypothetical protein